MGTLMTATNAVPSRQDCWCVKSGESVLKITIGLSTGVEFNRPGFEQNCVLQLVLTYKIIKFYSFVLTFYLIVTDGKL